jgi:hypothetical protein
MPPTEPECVPLRDVFGHPDDPQFDPIRAELAKLFIVHSADFVLDDWSNAETMRCAQSRKSYLEQVSWCPICRAPRQDEHLLKHCHAKLAATFALVAVANWRLIL